LSQFGHLYILIISIRQLQGYGASSSGEDNNSKVFVGGNEQREKAKVYTAQGVAGQTGGLG